MKPLLIIPPAPQRWPAFQELLGHLPPAQLDNVRRRLIGGAPGAQDAFAVIPVGSRFLAHACICRRGDVGVLAYGFTRPEERGRGHARRVMETLLGWFDMTGGKQLYLCTNAELDMGFYAKFGFVVFRRAVWAPFDRLTMIRPAAAVGCDPLAGAGKAAPSPLAGGDEVASCPAAGTANAERHRIAGGPPIIRELARADWPAMVQLLQYRFGPDPRVPLEETAVTADVITLDMIEHHERGSCLLLGAFAGQATPADQTPAGGEALSGRPDTRLISLATLCTDRSGKRTFAIVVPHHGAPPELNEAIQRSAAQRGYERVDFPMDALVAPDVPVGGATPPAV